MSATVPPPTARIRLRPYRLDDEELVDEMFSDELARRFYPDMEGRAEQWIGWNLGYYRQHGFGLWVLEDQETGEFLGDCGLTYQTVVGREMLEVGYHLLERHRGKGYATEAGKACLAFALEKLDASHVCSIIDPENYASQSVAGRIHSSSRMFTRDDGTTMWLYWTTADGSGRWPGWRRRPTMPREGD